MAKRACSFFVKNITQILQKKIRGHVQLTKHSSYIKDKKQLYKLQYNLKEKRAKSVARFHYINLE